MKGKNPETFQKKYVITFHHNRTKKSLHATLCIYLDSGELCPWQLCEREEHLINTKQSRYNIFMIYVTSTSSWNSGSIFFKITLRIVTPDIHMFFSLIECCSLASLDEIFIEVNCRSLFFFFFSGSRTLKHLLDYKILISPKIYTANIFVYHTLPASSALWWFS